MTMKITVTNDDDSARTAEVQQETFKVGDRYAGPATVEVVSLGPGESRSFWIHAARRITIIEDTTAVSAAHRRPE